MLPVYVCYKYSCANLFPVVEIGLQQVLYTVSEDGGALTVCAQINMGELERVVSLNLTSVDNTATSSS